MNYKQRVLAARQTKPGDKWQHRSKDKIVTIQKRIGRFKLEILHESGVVTTKQDHYLASEYEPIDATR